MVAGNRKCSFCLRHESQLKHLIKSGVSDDHFICDDCVGALHSIMPKLPLGVSQAFDNKQIG